MTQKLTRNLNDARWREFWKGVDAAASRAPTLHYQENEKPDCKEERKARSESPTKSSRK